MVKAVVRLYQSDETPVAQITIKNDDLGKPMGIPRYEDTVVYGGASYTVTNVKWVFDLEDMTIICEAKQA